MGCPMVIKFRTSKDGQKLVIKEFVKEHNHPINKVHVTKHWA